MTKQQEASDIKGNVETLWKVETSGCAAETQLLVTGPAVGLVNLGNTCFFNSAIQLLLACPQLNHAAMAAQGHGGTQHAFPGGASAMTVTPTVLGRGPLGFALRQAFINANGLHPSMTASRSSQPSAHNPHHHGAKGAYNPQALLAAVCRVAPRFKGRQQHDSHELMRLLLDGLQEEEKRAAEMSRRHVSKDASPPPSPASASPSPLNEGTSGNRGGAGAGDENSVVADSVIARLFGGELISSIRCGTCGHTSMSPEFFYDLSLPIPNDLPAIDKRELKGLATGATSSAAEEKTGNAAAAGKGKKLSKREKRELEKKEKKAQDAAAKAAVQKGGKDADAKGKVKGKERRKEKVQREGLDPEAAAEAEVEADAQGQPAGEAKQQQAEKDKCSKQEIRKKDAHGGNKAADEGAAAAFAAATPAAGEEGTKPSRKQLCKLEKEQRKIKIVAKRQAKKAGRGGAGSPEEAAELGQKGAESGIEEQPDKTSGGTKAECQKTEANQADAQVDEEQEAELLSTQAEGFSGPPVKPEGPPQSSSAVIEQPNDNLLAPDEAAAGTTVLATSDFTTKCVGDGAPCEIQQDMAEGNLASSRCNKDALPPIETAPSTVSSGPSLPCASSSLTKSSDDGKVKPQSEPEAPPTLPQAQPREQGAVQTQEQAQSGQEAAPQRQPPPSAPLPPPRPRVMDVGACLAAFFAAETVAWECPRERVEAIDASAPPSIVGSLAATPLTPSLRKQVSWSPSAPEVFLIPGSAEQRGTNLEEAIRGNAPFFRPARAHGSSFIVQAQLDPFDTETMHVQLQPFAGSTRSATLLAKAAAADAPSATAAGTSPIPAIPMSPVLSTILGSNPRGSPRGGGSGAGALSPPSPNQQPQQRRQDGANGGGGTAKLPPLDPGPFSERGLPLACLDVSIAWRCGDSPREQSRRVQAAAQLVMDCVADLMAAPGGLQHLLDMLAGGLKLVETPGPHSNGKRAAGSDSSWNSSGGRGDRVRFLLCGKYKVSCNPADNYEQLTQGEEAAGGCSSEAKARINPKTWNYPTALRDAEHPAFAFMRGFPGVLTPPDGSSSSSTSSATAASSSSSSPDMSPLNSDTELGLRKETDSIRRQMQRLPSPPTAAREGAVSSCAAAAAPATAGLPADGAAGTALYTEPLGSQASKNDASVPSSLADAADAIAGTAGDDTNRSAREAGRHPMQESGLDDNISMEQAGTQAALQNMHGVNLDPALHPHHHHHHHHHQNHHHQQQLLQRHRDSENGGHPRSPAVSREDGEVTSKPGASNMMPALASNGDGDADGDADGLFEMDDLSSPIAFGPVSEYTHLTKSDQQDRPSPSSKLTSQSGSILALLSPPPLYQSPLTPDAKSSTIMTSPTQSRSPLTLVAADNTVNGNDDNGAASAAAVKQTLPAIARNMIAAAIPMAINGAALDVTSPASTAAAAGDTTPNGTVNSGGITGDAKEHHEDEDGLRIRPPSRPRILPPTDPCADLISGLESESEAGYRSGSESNWDVRGSLAFCGLEGESGGNVAGTGSVSIASQPIKIPNSNSPSSPFSTPSMTHLANANGSDGDVNSVLHASASDEPTTISAAARTAADQTRSGRSGHSGSGGLRRSGGGAASSFQRASTKKYYLRQAPEVLVLHLKRFAMDGHGRLNKVDKHVAFDTTLDLAPFLAAAAAAVTVAMAAVTAAAARPAPASSNVVVSQQADSKLCGEEVALNAAGSNGVAQAASMMPPAATWSPEPADPPASDADRGCKDGSDGALNGSDTGSSRLPESIYSVKLGTPVQGEQQNCNEQSSGLVDQGPAGALRGPDSAQQPQQQPRSALATAVAMQQSTASALKPCLYDLLGVVEHSGDMRYGHYVAYVKRSKPGTDGAAQWYYVSDTQVRPVAEAQVLQAQAYILMYTRRPDKLPLLSTQADPAVDVAPAPVTYRTRH